MKNRFLFAGILVFLLTSFTERGHSVGLLDKLFGSKKTVAEKDLSEHRPYLDSLRIPAIRIEAGGKPGPSKIGGLPLAPASLQWPVWHEKPLAFLGQFDLGALPKTAAAQGLPEKGILYFFYDQDQSTWGFDPNDRDSWKVLYVNGNEPLVPIKAPAGLGNDFIFNEKPVKFTEIQSYPDWQDERIGALDLNDTQSDEYVDLCESVYGGQPAHQIFGYPSPIQGNDMDLECQLASHGLYCGDSSGYNDPRAKELEVGKDQWVLLLQLDSDDDAGMMWGDAGMLYFWIRKDDLKSGNFSKVWMISQCY